MQIKKINVAKHLFSKNSVDCVMKIKKNSENIFHFFFYSSKKSLKKIGTPEQNKNVLN